MNFIFMPNPNGSTTKSRRQVHSHAARAAHARTRRLRMASYMQQKNSVKHERNHESSDRQDQAEALPFPSSLSGAFEHEPLASFLKSLAPREHFLFDHYVKVVLPDMCSKCEVMQSSKAHHDHMSKNWVLFSSVDIDLMRGFLFASCRHLSMIHEDEYTEYAIQYKLAFIQSLREVISTKNPSFGRVAVTKAMVLAFDDILLGDHLMASKHISAALQMVQMAGGFRAFGSTSFIQYVLSNCVYGKRLLDLDPTLHGTAISVELDRHERDYPGF